MLRTKNISFFQKDTFDKEDREKTSFYMFSHEVFSRGKTGYMQQECRLPPPRCFGLPPHPLAEGLPSSEEGLLEPLRSSSPFLLS